MKLINKMQGLHCAKGNKRALKRLTIFILATLIFTLLPSYPGTAVARSTQTSAGADVLKHEVIYANLDSDGTAEQIYVVNHYDLAEAQSFTDYGDYETVLQLTGKNMPVLSGSEVHLQAEKGQYYYQGNLKSKELPWLIDMSYELDGKMIDASKLGGADGELVIRTSIKANPAIDSFFFNNYALQISDTINPQKAEILEVDDAATLAFSGKNRQINWVVLPGQEIELYIRLQVNDFEMDAMTIAGVSLNFDIEIPDLSEQSAPLGDLSEGIAQLADGAQELETGFDQLLAAYKELEDGSTALSDNGSKIISGTNELKDGSSKLNSGVSEYAAAISTISNAMTGFNSGLNLLYPGIAELAAQADPLSNGSGEILSGLKTLADALNDADSLADLDNMLFSEEDLAGLSQLISASETIKTSLSDLAAGLSSIDDLYTGMQELQQQLSQLETIVAQFPQMSAVTQRSAEDWDIYLTNDLGVDIPQDVKTDLLNELAGLSATASLYNQVIGMLNQTLAMLNDQTQGIPAVVYALSQIKLMSDGVSELSEQYTNMHTALEELTTKLTSMAATAAELLPMADSITELKTALKLLADEYENFDTGLTTYTDGVQSLLPAFEGSGNETGLIDGAAQLNDALKQLNQNSVSLTTGISAFDSGISDYQNGITTYIDGVQSVMKGLTEYRSEGLEPLESGLSDFSEGATELKDATASLQDDFTEELEKLVDEYLSTDFEPRSFVSSQNTHVGSVQFVFMTKAIKSGSNNGSSFEPEVDRGFFGRLTDLFKIKNNE